MSKFLSVLVGIGILTVGWILLWLWRALIVVVSVLVATKIFHASFLLGSFIGVLFAIIVESILGMLDIFQRVNKWTLSLASVIEG